MLCCSRPMLFSLSFCHFSLFSASGTKYVLYVHLVILSFFSCSVVARSMFSLCTHCLSVVFLYFCFRHEVCILYAHFVVMSFFSCSAFGTKYVLFMHTLSFCHFSLVPLLARSMFSLCTLCPVIFSCSAFGRKYVLVMHTLSFCHFSLVLL